MEAKKWKSRIVKAMKAVGTYQPAFDSVILTLASILERRDEAEEVYINSGNEPIVEHTNKGGATNLEQNPVLRLINDLNRDALQYWRDLGLTPSGLRKINEEALQGKKMSALDSVLASLEKD